MKNSHFKEPKDVTMEAIQINGSMQMYVKHQDGKSDSSYYVFSVIFTFFAFGDKVVIF